jgi:MFS family permease
MEDELIKIWQSSSKQERIKFEKSKLMIELQSSLGRLHRWWKYLELVEVISAIIGILLFVFIAFWIPFVLSKIASVFIVICLIYLLFRLYGIHRFKPNDLNHNYLEYLKKSKAYLIVQKKLIETSIYWYILPCLSGVMLFLLGVDNVPFRILSIMFLLVVFFGVFSYYLNRRRVKNEINPRLAKVEELLEELKEAL